jgi:hypothetical protein
MGMFLYLHIGHGKVIRHELMTDGTVVVSAPIKHGKVNRHRLMMDETVLVSMYCSSKCN